MLEQQVLDVVAISIAQSQKSTLRILKTWPVRTNQIAQPFVMNPRDARRAADESDGDAVILSLRR